MSRINEFWSNKLQSSISTSFKHDAPLKCKIKFLFTRRNYCVNLLKHIDGCRLFLGHCIDEECRFHYKPPTGGPIKIIGISYQHESDISYVNDMEGEDE